MPIPDSHLFPDSLLMRAKLKCLTLKWCFVKCSDCRDATIVETILYKTKIKMDLLLLLQVDSSNIVIVKGILLLWIVIEI
jgi:hypothetical protein